MERSVRTNKPTKQHKIGNILRFHDAFDEIIVVIGQRDMLEEGAEFAARKICRVADQPEKKERQQARMPRSDFPSRWNTESPTPAALPQARTSPGNQTGWGRGRDDLRPMQAADSTRSTARGHRRLLRLPKFAEHDLTIAQWKGEQQLTVPERFSSAHKRMVSNGSVNTLTTPIVPMVAPTTIAPRSSSRANMGLRIASKLTPRNQRNDVVVESPQ